MRVKTRHAAAMPKAKPLLLLWLCAGCLVLLSTPAFALRCGTRLIQVGDEKEEVEARCGPPFRKEVWEQELILTVSDAVERSRIVTVEEWVYNFGPNRLMMLLKFEGKRLKNIETRGRGFPEGPLVSRPCNERTTSIGDTKAEVLLKCGEPQETGDLRETVSVALDALRRRKAVLSISEWTYDTGPNAFKRILVFENNRLVKIRLGERGD